MFIYKKKMIKIFKDIKSKGGKIVGYGASAKAVTVVNYCNLKENFFRVFHRHNKEQNWQIFTRHKNNCKKIQ